jgi:hypothetical protein
MIMACMAIYGVAISSAMAGEWKIVADGTAVTPSESSPQVLAAAKYIGPGPDVFVPYFAVAGSDLCGGKNHDPVGSESGLGSIQLSGLPKIASVTKCDSGVSMTFPETDDGLRVLSAYFMRGDLRLVGSGGDPIAQFNARDLVSSMIVVMRGRLNRGM